MHMSPSSKAILSHVIALKEMLSRNGSYMLSELVLYSLFNNLDKAHGVAGPTLLALLLIPNFSREVYAVNIMEIKLLR